MEATTTQVVATCDGCGARYRVAAENAGKRLKCRKCGLIVSVPVDGARRAPSTARPNAKPAAAKSTTQPITPPQSSRAAGSLRERANQRHQGFHFGPIQVVLVVGLVVVFVLYKMLAH